MTITSFSESKYDYSLYIKRDDTNITMFLVNVDDIIIIGKWVFDKDVKRILALKISYGRPGDTKVFLRDLQGQKLEHVWARENMPLS